MLNQTNSQNTHSETVSRAIEKAAEKQRRLNERIPQNDLRCADQDTYNLIYNGGNSSPFPGME